MDCNEARLLVDASIDRELSAADELRIRQHLAGCADCRRDSEAARVTAQAVRRADYHRAPDTLRASIVAALPSTAPSPSPAASAQRARPPSPLDGWRRYLPRAWGGAQPAGQPGIVKPAGSVWLAGLALVMCAVVAMTVTLHRSDDAGPFVDELVASHVRAQLSGRDIDVVSTDQHTVKPWFNGRLDYAPPVEDLSASGFTLIGGRLDYVGHERVAVLVYRYRKHIIDVYVFPPGAREAHAPAPSTPRDGYAVARWQSGGMAWWAVTDAAPEALAALEQALKSREQTPATE